MLPAAPEADELQQLPLELPRYLLVALRESGGHRAYALLPPYATAPRRAALLAVRADGCADPRFGSSFRQQMQENVDS